MYFDEQTRGLQKERYALGYADRRGYDGNPFTLQAEMKPSSANKNSHSSNSGKGEAGSSQTLISLALAVGALVALVVFFGPEESSETIPQTVESTTTAVREKAPESTTAATTPQSVNSMPNVEKFPAGAKMIVGSADNPPPELPEDLRQALENQSRELPPEMQAQLNAAPPELPEDLRRQLANQPTELPEDLQRQLNMPPPPIPDDIKKALETPPREVSLDEVNTPPTGR